MLNKSEKNNYLKEYHKKCIGVTMFWLGIAVAIISMMMLGIGFYYMNSIEDSIAIYIEFIIFFIALVVTVIGAILYFVGRSQAKKQKNQNSSIV